MSKFILSRYLFCLFVLCFEEDLTAQTYKNRVTKLGFGFSTFSESVWDNDTFFVVGTAGYHFQGSNAGIIKVDREGEIINVVTLLDTQPLFNYGFWNKGVLLVDDTLFHVASLAYGGGKAKGAVLKVSGNGQILDSVSVSNFYSNDIQVCNARDFKRYSEGIILVDRSWRKYNDSQCCLSRFDHDLNLIWRKCYGDANIDSPEQVFVLSNGHFVVVGFSTDEPSTEIYVGKGNAYYTSYIFETDQNGNLLWEWRTPEGIESANGAYLESDSTLVVAASIGRDLCFGPRPDDHCQLEWNGKVYKFNLKTREKIWETTLLGDQYGALWENSILDIIPSMEHDGYIVSGSDYYKTTPDCSQIDTSDRCWNTPGIIAKVSNEGDSLWMRRYVGIVDIFTSNLLFDAEITPDSGYSFVGETFNVWPGPDQGQHGWLLMTDRYGCLVPGCHLTSSIMNEEGDIHPSQRTFKIHPNPTSDFLNVFITRDLPKSANLYLFNSIGMEVDRWTNFDSGTTYIISIDQHPPGLYYLTMSDGHQVLGSEKVIFR